MKEPWNWFSPAVISVLVSAVGLAFAGGWAVAMFVSSRRRDKRASHAKIHAAGVSLVRHLEAGLAFPRDPAGGQIFDLITGNPSTKVRPTPEGSPPDGWPEAWNAARHMREGFDIVEPEFKELLNLAPGAKAAVSQLIRDARDHFYRAADLINRADGQAALLRDIPVAWLEMRLSAEDLRKVLTLTENA